MHIDRILTNADIITMDPDRPTARRLGVLAGRIVGFDDELDGVSADVVDDLAGATVTPGFFDAHCHTAWFGLGLAGIDAGAVATLDELYDAVRERAAQLGDDRDAWIDGVGFDHFRHGGAYPDIDRLDEAAGGHPVYLRHTSGHAAIVNTEVLRRAGVLDPATPNPAGGEIVRDAEGRPTGLLDETAQTIAQDQVRPYALDTLVDAIDRATRQYASQGITSFTDAGVGGGWIGQSGIEVAAYQAALDAGRLHARAQLMPVLDSLVPIEGNARDAHGHGSGLGLTLGMRTGFGGERLALGHVKVFSDGSLLGRTSAMTEPFCGHPHNRGYLQRDPAEFRELLDAAYRTGWSLAVHAIGDAAIDLALELIGSMQERYGRNLLPNRIEHAGITRPEQLERMRDLGIAVTPQASFYGPIGDGMMALLDEERRPWLYRARSFVDGGVLLAGSSDCPVADNDVRRALQSCVERRTDSGAPFTTPDERLTPRQALYTYTVAPAIVAGQLADKGTLSRGKLADLAVLDGSPLTADRIDALRVLATAVGGEWTHDARDEGAAPAASTTSNGAAR